MLSVVLSLAFVGFELRQGNAIARAETRQSLTDASMELFLTRATNPELNSKFYEFIQGSNGSLDCEGEHSEACAYGNALLRHLENVYLQSREGVIDESVFSSYGYEGSILNRPRMQQLLAESGIGFDAGFVSEVKLQFGSQ